MSDPLTHWNNKAELRLPKSNDLVWLKPARNGVKERWMGRETHEQGETITIYIKADSCLTPPLTLLGADCCWLSPEQTSEKREAFVRDEACRGALQGRKLLFATD